MLPTTGARASLRNRPPATVVTACRDGVTSIDCVCHQGRHSPIAGGQYRTSRIVVVFEGAFFARTSGGDALLGHGALLLGNPGAAYEYRHVDDGGDHCVGFDYEAHLLEDVRRSFAESGRGSAAPVFERASLPASPASTAAVALARDAARHREPDGLHHAALAVLDAALTAPGRGALPSHLRPSPRTERGVVRTLRYIEHHVADDCSLDALARLAGLSSFHYLRVFRLLTGQTPRQFVIAARLRAAAAALRATRIPIARAALTAGFGDLSHFYASFTRAFGCSPLAYRSGRTR